MSIIEEGIEVQSSLMQKGTQLTAGQFSRLLVFLYYRDNATKSHSLECFDYDHERVVQDILERTEKTCADLLSNLRLG